MCAIVIFLGNYECCDTENVQKVYGKVHETFSLRRKTSFVPVFFSTSTSGSIKQNIQLVNSPDQLVTNNRHVL
jgi:hypothetical protein